MSTTLDLPAGFAASPEHDERCHVAVLYEDTEARERAVVLSHHLVEGFWQELDFSFSWWRFRYLEDGALAEEAAQSALMADVLVFSALAAGQPPPEVRDWIELWAPQRTAGPGVLVPLLHPGDPESLSESPWLVELEDLAQRMSLECLLPYRLRESALFDPSSRNLNLRCRHMGGVMGNILRQQAQIPEIRRPSSLDE